jgi:uncharacterized protein (TIGR02145 family)
MTFLLFAMLFVHVTQGAFTDPRDNNTYGVVRIAGVEWMTANLRTALPNSWCPQDDLKLCESMGRLYPWEEAVRACPAGWRLSSERDWQALERHLGMSAAEIENERLRGAAGALGDHLKENGSSKLAFPFAGWRRPDGTFAVGNGNDRAAAIWTSTVATPGRAWHRDLSSVRGGIWRSPVEFSYALSARCVRDATANQ